MLFFPYSFVSLIVLISLFLCCYFSFIYVGSFPIVFYLLFCVSSSLFILALLSCNFFVGYGTTHKVNNLLIQNEVRSPKNKWSRRSFNAEYEPCYNTTYFSSKRIGPAPKGSWFWSVSKSSPTCRSHINDFLWVFLRCHSIPKQIIPSWAGFIIVHDGMVVLKSSVSYIDCINAPATEMTTIYQVWY